MVVVLPEELDMTTAEQMREQLSSAFTPGVVAVIADMTSTEFCDTTCFRILLSTIEIAQAKGVSSCAWFFVVPVPCGVSCRRWAWIACSPFIRASTQLTRPMPARKRTPFT